MSRHKWADALVIQAVADALNLAIQIIESNPGFASVTNISPVRSETDTTVINIGHLDEIQTFNRRKQSNSDHIREFNRQAFAKSKTSNPQHV